MGQARLESAARTRRAPFERATAQRALRGFLAEARRQRRLRSSEAADADVLQLPASLSATPLAKSECDLQSGPADSQGPFSEERKQQLSPRERRQAPGGEAFPHEVKGGEQIGSEATPPPPATASPPKPRKEEALDVRADTSRTGDREELLHAAAILELEEETLLSQAEPSNRPVCLSAARLSCFSPSGHSSAQTPGELPCEASLLRVLDSSRAETVTDSDCSLYKLSMQPFLFGQLPPSLASPLAEDSSQRQPFVGGTFDEEGPSRGCCLSGICVPYSGADTADGEEEENLDAEELAAALDDYERCIQRTPQPEEARSGECLNCGGKVRVKIVPRESVHRVAPDGEISAPPEPQGLSSTSGWRRLKRESVPHAAACEASESLLCYASSRAFCADGLACHDREAEGPLELPRNPQLAPHNNADRRLHNGELDCEAANLHAAMPPEKRLQDWVWQMHPRACAPAVVGVVAAQGRPTLRLPVSQSCQTQRLWASAATPRFHRLPSNAYLWTHRSCSSSSGEETIPESEFCGPPSPSLEAVIGCGQLPKKTRRKPEESERRSCTKSRATSPVLLLKRGSASSMECELPTCSEEMSAPVKDDIDRVYTSCEASQAESLSAAQPAKPRAMKIPKLSQFFGVGAPEPRCPGRRQNRCRPPD